MSDHSQRRIGKLVHFAIDKLWHCVADEDPDGDFFGCCPRCCAPCGVLAELLESGELDAWVLGWPDQLPGTSWWDASRSQVDRDFLERAWSRADEMGCHSTLTFAGRPIKQVNLPTHDIAM